MAEVVVKFDTISKEMSVSVAGEILSDIYSLSFYKRYSEESEDMFECSISTESKKNENGMKERKYLCASESEKGKELLECGRATASQALEGYVETREQVGIQSAIASYLGRD